MIIIVASLGHLNTRPQSSQRAFFVVLGTRRQTSLKMLTPQHPIRRLNGSVILAGSASACAVREDPITNYYTAWDPKSTKYIMTYTRDNASILPQAALGARRFPHPRLAFLVEKNSGKQRKAEHLQKIKGQAPPTGRSTQCPSPHTTTPSHQQRYRNRSRKG